jgi:hypothetical protein
LPQYRRENIRFEVYIPDVAGRLRISPGGRRGAQRLFLSPVVCASPISLCKALLWLGFRLHP